MIAWYWYMLAVTVIILLAVYCGLEVVGDIIEAAVDFFIEDERWE